MLVGRRWRLLCWRRRLAGYERDIAGSRFLPPWRYRNTLYKHADDDSNWIGVDCGGPHFRSGDAGEGLGVDTNGGWENRPCSYPDRAADCSLLLSMLRYTSQYYFVNFQSYQTLDAIKHASLMALSPVVAGSAIGGLVVATLIRRFSSGSIVALTLALYVLVTIGFSLFDPLADLIQQLETPRLMPFQRLLAIYLAAWMAGWLLEQITSWFHSSWREWLIAAALVTCSLTVLMTFYNEQFGELGLPYQQPPEMTTGVVEFAEFEAAVKSIDQLAPDDSAIMIVGDQESWWHESFGHRHSRMRCSCMTIGCGFGTRIIRVHTIQPPVTPIWTQLRLSPESGLMPMGLVL